jgi:exosortase/archaeosortase family protein
MRHQEKEALNMTLIAIACALLMLLPLVTTFDDLLTAWALRLGANNPLQSIVPVEAGMVVSMLGLVGIKAAASGSHMVVWDGAGSMHTLFISWNCIGWQSVLLLGVSFISGLRGRQSLDSRLQVVVIGVAGTMLLNLARVAMVAALEASWGHLPALLFHDYAGTIIVIVWLFAFWIFVQRWVLAPVTLDIPCPEASAARPRPDLPTQWGG